MDTLVPPHNYPSGVVPAPARKIEGTAFFPGGCGLYFENRHRDAVKFPFQGVMVLGHNFDSKNGFNESFGRGREELNSGTWRSLLAMLKETAIRAEECLFTNAFMGSCPGSDNKAYRGRDDEGFRASCLAFLMVQIEIQRPRLILTPGLHAAPLLAEGSSNLNPWERPHRALRV